MSEGARTPGQVGAILLAAGLSTRMGRPKPLLPWDGRSLVAYQVAQLHAAGVDDVVVVTGHAAAVVEEALRGCGARLVHNPDYEQGRASSVRAGAQAIPDDAEAVVVLSVDQPRPADVTHRLLAAHRRAGAPITVPVYEGRRGHPVIFAGALLAELRAVTEAGEGLRAIMGAHAGGVREVCVDDARVLLDLNTPEAYEAGLTAFGLGSRRL